MKEYNKDFDLDFSPMSDETMSWLDELLMTCKHFNVDYYNASEKDRAFVEAVARKNYGLKQGLRQWKNRFHRCAILWHSSCRLSTSGSPAMDMLHRKNHPPPQPLVACFSLLF